jgi:dihydroflavonol-4-reductase
MGGWVQERKSGTDCFSETGLVLLYNIAQPPKKVNEFPLPEAPTPLKALVTGATGFIGSHLVELLLKKNVSVRVLLRRSSDTRWLKDLPVELEYGDLFDHDALRKAVTGVDYVYHSAGLTKAKTREEYFRGNEAGTVNILGATEKFAPGLKRFVQISSGAAAGPSEGMDPITEQTPCHPITTYGRSKRAAEEACEAKMGVLPITIVRPPAVYGPRDKDVFEFFNTMSKGLQPMVGMAEKYVSLIHVGDLVRGFEMAATSQNSVGKTYFITSKELYNWKQIGEVTRNVLGRPALRLRIPEFGVYGIAAVAELLSKFSSKPALINFEKAKDMVQDYWTFSHVNAEKDFGFVQQISLEEGIKDTVGWYRAQKWL